MNSSDQLLITANPWRYLNRFTPARIALGRAGMSQTTRTHLDFQLAHALARDAVNLPLDFAALIDALTELGFPSRLLTSQAEHHASYLQRPDLGRKLSDASKRLLRQRAPDKTDAVVIIADGLSSAAIANHALAFISLLLPELTAKSLCVSELCLVKHGRVAIGDEIAEHFGARFCIMIIGERPGLSSPDSMGIYFTYQAKPGISTDADRNCISNIHGNGLSYQNALTKLMYLINQAEILGLSGVALKDETTATGLPDQHPAPVNFLLD